MVGGINDRYFTHARSRWRVGKSGSHRKQQTRALTHFERAGTAHVLCASSFSLRSSWLTFPVSFRHRHARQNQQYA
eukprot:5963856-Amphidinium_carterae.1